MVQTDNTEQFSDSTPTYHSSGSTLLKKFDIPLHHLDFEYVNACKNPEELEKILQILKSGEEGYYPQLTARTEERLIELKPNSKFIRKTVKVLNKEDVNKETYNEISDDLTMWLIDINKKNEELESVRNKGKKVIPEIRQSKQVNNDENKKKVLNRIKSTDYAAWDKYDADTELLKMDLEDKKVKIEAEKLEKETRKKPLVKFNPFLTSAEAVFEAQRENEKANDYFKAKEYEDAIEHYNNSILYQRNATTFKNRASAYTAIKNYENALADYKEALKFNEYDFDALLRIAQCYHQLKKHSEATVFIEKAICVNPNDDKAQKLAESIRKCNDVKPSKVRMNISNVLKETETKRDVEFKKSILKNGDKVIVPIPGTSKMPGPYYKVVNRSDLPVKKVECSNRDKPLKGKPKSVKFVSEKLSNTERNDQGNIENVNVKIMEIKESKTEMVKKNETNVKISKIQESKIPVVHQVKDLKAGGEPFLSSTAQDINPEQIHMPYSFIQAWLTARKENNYMGFAKIIRNLDSRRLTEVIGNKLDATMLRELLNCLYRHFTVAHEVERVYNLLLNLCEVDRFNIVIMFLSNEDKTLLQNLVNFLKQHGKMISVNILQAYNLH